MNSLILSFLISSFLFYRHEFYDNITDSFLFKKKKTRFHYVVLASLEKSHYYRIHRDQLVLPPGCWDPSYVTPYPANCYVFGNLLFWYFLGVWLLRSTMQLYKGHFPYLYFQHFVIYPVYSLTHHFLYLLSWCWSLIQLSVMDGLSVSQI